MLRFDSEIDDVAELDDVSKLEVIVILIVYHLLERVRAVKHNDSPLVIQ